MSTSLPNLRIPTLALCLLALACDSGSKGKEDATKDAAKTEAKDDAKAKAKAEPAPPPKPKPPKLGKRPPDSMSPEEIKQFAVDAGDPTGGEFGLEQAFEGAPELADASKGKLTATITTSMGAFDCELLEKEAPITVANFVGLARGVRPFYDHKKGEWVKEKFYDGVIWHRVMEDFMVQTGDRSTAGGTNNAGFVIVDELEGKHSKAGTLSMANQQKPNTGSTQFFVTVKPTSPLDGKHAVFGYCDPKVAIEISKVKVNKDRNHRPYERVLLESITISRK